MTRRNFDGQWFLDPGNEHFETRVGIEHAVGVFLEGEYSAIEDWFFTLGARHQHNDFRQPGNAMLYRAAAIWMPARHWSFKYLYNTGDVRPALIRVRGSANDPLIITNPGYTTGTVAEVGPDRPQLAISHDLQAMYAAGASRATLTLYRQDTRNYVVRATPFPTGAVWDSGIPIWNREINAGELRAYGLEFEAEHRARDDWLLYGNYSVALNRATETVLPTGGPRPVDLVADTTYFAPNRRVTGVPKYGWNLGADWTPLENQVLNLHYRGWYDLWGKISTDSASPFKHYGTQHFFDFTYSWQNAFGRSADLQVYVKNAFDNRTPTAQAAHVGEIAGLGREVGIVVTIRLAPSRAS